MEGTGESNKNMKQNDNTRHGTPSSAGSLDSQRIDRTEQNLIEQRCSLSVSGENPFDVDLNMVIDLFQNGCVREPTFIIGQTVSRQQNEAITTFRSNYDDSSKNKDDNFNNANQENNGTRRGTSKFSISGENPFQVDLEVVLHHFMNSEAMQKTAIRTNSQKSNRIGHSQNAEKEIEKSKPERVSAASTISGETTSSSSPQLKTKIEPRFRLVAASSQSFDMAVSGGNQVTPPTQVDVVEAASTSSRKTEDHRTSTIRGETTASTSQPNDVITTCRSNYDDSSKNKDDNNAYQENNGTRRGTSKFSISGENPFEVDLEVVLHHFMNSKAMQKTALSGNQVTPPPQVHLVEAASISSREAEDHQTSTISGETTLSTSQQNEAITTCRSNYDDSSKNKDDNFNNANQENNGTRRGTSKFSISGENPFQVDLEVVLHHFMNSEAMQKTAIRTNSQKSNRTGHSQNAVKEIVKSKPERVSAASTISGPQLKTKIEPRFRLVAASSQSLNVAVTGGNQVTPPRQVDVVEAASISSRKTEYHLTSTIRGETTASTSPQLKTKIKPGVRLVVASSQSLDVAVSGGTQVTPPPQVDMVEAASTSSREAEDHQTSTISGETTASTSQQNEAITTFRSNYDDSSKNKDDNFNNANQENNGTGRGTSKFFINGENPFQVDLEVVLHHFMNSTAMQKTAISLTTSEQEPNTTVDMCRVVDMKLYFLEHSYSISGTNSQKSNRTGRSQNAFKKIEKSKPERVSAASTISGETTSSSKGPPLKTKIEPRFRLVAASSQSLNVAVSGGNQVTPPPQLDVFEAASTSSRKTEEIRVNEIRLVRRDTILLSARIIAEKHNVLTEQREFYVHFEGLNKRFDEWVTADRIMEDGCTTKKEWKSAVKAVIGQPDVFKCTRSVKRNVNGNQLLHQIHEEMDPVTDSSEIQHDSQIKHLNVIEIGKYEIDTWYFSPFQQGFHKFPKLFICEYCLYYMNMHQIYIQHMLHCPHKKPPGKEIYRKANLSVYEADGETNKMYCQYLCLLGKLFLEDKVVCFDIERFSFYVLCTVDTVGHHIVGYFSKEKYSSQGYNLACIMVLPPFQRAGYGKFLIAFSYELSKIEKKVGSPEKPLSDLGKLTYRSYWSWVLLNTLRGKRGMVLVRNLSEITFITYADITDTLRSMNIVKYWKGEHVVDVNPKLVKELMKRLPFKKPLLRVDPKAIEWKPRKPELRKRIKLER